MLSDNAIVSIVFGTLGVLASAGASYGAVKWSLAALTTKLADIEQWLQKVADGDTRKIGEIETRLDQHDAEIEDHRLRLTNLEIEHAKFTGRGHCK